MYLAFNKRVIAEINKTPVAGRNCFYLDVLTADLIPCPDVWSASSHNTQDTWGGSLKTFFCTEGAEGKSLAMIPDKLSSRDCAKAGFVAADYISPDHRETPPKDG